MPQLTEHLHIVSHTLQQTFRLHLPRFAHEEVVLLAKVELYLPYCRPHPFGRGDKKVGRIYLELIVGAERRVIGRMDGLDRLNLIAPECNTHYDLLIGKTDVDGVALHTECAA
jgi:hypothetical protein